MLNRFLAAVVYILPFCTLAIARAQKGQNAAISTAIGEPLHSVDATQLAAVISVGMAFIALVLHLATLAAGYGRWGRLSATSWAWASFIAGFAAYAVWRGVDRISGLLQPNTDFLPKTIVVLIATVATTFTVFECLRLWQSRGIRSSNAS